MKNLSFLVMALLIMVVSACSGDENEEAENKKSEDKVSASEQEDKADKEQSSEKDNANKEEDKNDNNDSKKSSDEGGKKNESYPIPEFVDNVRQEVEFWIPKADVKSAFGEPNFTLELGDENTYEDYDSDFIYYFKEDGSKYEGDSDVQKANAMKKGKELAKNGDIQVVAKFSFNNENEKLESITMYYVKDGELFYYYEAHDMDPKNLPEKEK